MQATQDAKCVPLIFITLKLCHSRSADVSCLLSPASNVCFLSLLACSDPLSKRNRVLLRSYKLGGEPSPEEIKNEGGNKQSTGGHLWPLESVCQVNGSLVQLKQRKVSREGVEPAGARRYGAVEMVLTGEYIGGRGLWTVDCCPVRLKDLDAS